MKDVDTRFFGENVKTYLRVVVLLNFLCKSVSWRLMFLILVVFYKAGVDLWNINQWYTWKRSLVFWEMFGKTETEFELPCLLSGRTMLLLLSKKQFLRLPIPKRIKWEDVFISKGLTIFLDAHYSFIVIDLALRSHGFLFPCISKYVY